ncbi:MAG: molybdopterin-guanine dinucleotide biosynthesis protein B [Candidatus Margulisiibacteriota bacterium]
MPPIICVVGASGSGKTTLIEGLIAGLSAKGYFVGAVKHHYHGDFEIDHEGKDTWRHARAGAKSISISSPTMFALIKRVPDELTLDEIAAYMEDRDVIPADGFTRSDKPRIVIVTKEGDVTDFGRGRKVVATIRDPSDGEGLAVLIDAVEAIIRSGR